MKIASVRVVTKANLHNEKRNVKAHTVTDQEGNIHQVAAHMATRHVGTDQGGGVKVEKRPPGNHPYFGDHRDKQYSEHLKKTEELKLKKEQAMQAHLEDYGNDDKKAAMYAARSEHMEADKKLQDMRAGRGFEEAPKPEEKTEDAPQKEEKPKQEQKPAKEQQATGKKVIQAVNTGTWSIGGDDGYEGQYDTLLHIPLDAIEPDPNQPRKDFDDDHIKNLATSIETEGLHEPIVLRVSPKSNDKLMIVMGECRWRAHKALQKDGKIDSAMCIVKKWDEDTARKAAFAENVIRKDMRPMETAKGLAVMFDIATTKEGMNEGQALEHVAKQYKRTVAQVRDAIQLVNLIPEYHPLVNKGQLQPALASKVASLSKADQGNLLGVLKFGDTWQKNVDRINSYMAAKEQVAFAFMEPEDPAEKIRQTERRAQKQVELDKARKAFGSMQETMGIQTTENIKRTKRKSADERQAIADIVDLYPDEELPIVIKQYEDLMYRMSTVIAAMKTKTGASEMKDMLMAKVKEQGADILKDDRQRGLIQSRDYLDEEWGKDSVPEDTGPSLFGKALIAVQAFARRIF